MERFDIYQIDKCQAYAGEIDLSAENLMKAARNMVLPEGQTLRDRLRLMNTR